MTSLNLKQTLTTALLSATLILSACVGGATTAAPAVSGEATGEPAANGTRQIEADNGTIEVPANPQRIATIGNTTLPFIDLGGQPIAVTAESDSDVSRLPEDQQATYASATILAASADEVDMEELASLKPDLILVQVPGGEFELIKTQLESIAPTVFFGLDTEWKALADGIAEAGNTTNALSKQKVEFEERLAEIQEKYREIIDDTSFVDVIRWTSSDPGTFAIADIGCSEIARDEVGMDLPEAAEGDNPLAWTSLSFEQIGELSEYDVILYPVDAEGQPTEPFVPVVETNSWQALPEVISGHALGVFCPGNNSYGAVLRYLDSLDRALATLPANADDPSPSTESGTRQVEADNGTIEVPADPQRVAVLGNAVLPYLDLGGKPIAVTELSSSTLADLPSDQQAAYAAATNVGASGGETDLEKLATLTPDVIVLAAPDGDYEELKDKLNAIAPTVHLGFQSDWKFRATAIAEATNKSDVFNEQKARYNELVTQLQQEYGMILTGGKVVEAIRTDGSQPGMFNVNGSLCAEAARDEGIIDFAPYAETSFEQIGSLAEYELILYSAGINGDPSEPMAALMEANAWKALPAVQSGHAQGVYCPWGRSYGFMAQYLEGLERALATLPKAE